MRSTSVSFPAFKGQLTAIIGARVTLLLSTFSRPDARMGGLRIERIQRLGNATAPLPSPAFSDINGLAFRCRYGIGASHGQRRAAVSDSRRLARAGQADRFDRQICRSKFFHDVSACLWWRSDRTFCQWHKVLGSPRRWPDQGATRPRLAFKECDECDVIRDHDPARFRGAIRIKVKQ
jgi:hypothetical protein